ncbi:uncharacterized protein LOC128200496 [Galleria mellonella]|uniref:Uncharacterized protein LOC128200496 n=1 Tax=Galleria mellonella TaxID=7137 RepID=A0ABM3MFY6_GALME|nr:uncharacterized protein LOC128200496 [Galleria mellonella]
MQRLYRRRGVGCQEHSSYLARSAVKDAFRGVRLVSIVTTIRVTYFHRDQLCRRPTNKHVLGCHMRRCMSHLIQRGRGQRPRLRRRAPIVRRLHIASRLQDIQCILPMHLCHFK